MLKKLVAIAAIALLVSDRTTAQMQPCGTDERYWELVKKYPQLAAYEEEFNAQLDNQVNMRTTAVDTTIYHVPIVIHIVHDYGVENIPDNAIYEAAAYWAVVYKKQNDDTSLVIPTFKPYIGNSRIHLHLATKDPNGNPTKGVVRHQSYLTFVADDQAKFNQWPQNKYINIWFINSFGSSGAAAYAYAPNTAATIPFYDGIISLHSYLNYAKAIPHELGHVLNLRHTWGNTNSAGVSCGNDNVDDTPPTKGHTPVGCVPSALYDTVCATGYLKHYTASGGGDSVVDYPDTANAQNIMDYTYCQRMFTHGQGVRMRAALTSATASRNNLITSTNLAATGALAPMPDLPPVADFYVAKASAGGFSDPRTYFMAFNNTATFTFRNASWNDTISGIQWNFSNGATTPTSTNTVTVSNRFSVPGWVTVTLTANSNAGSDTLVNTQAVYAADTTPVGGTGYHQEFSSASAIGDWPMFNFYNNPFKWEFFTGAGVGDNTCLRYHSFDQSTSTSLSRVTGIAIGDHDDIYTPAFNLENTPPTLYLDFFTCGSSTSKDIGSGDPQVYDSIEVEVSSTGGGVWTHLQTYKGTDLANNPASNSDFVPTTSSAWKGRTVTIPSANRARSTYFRLRYWPGNKGNNLYVDRLSISSFPADVQEAVSSQGSFDVFPNPTANGCTLAFKTGNSGLVNYTVTDIAGKVVHHETKQYDPNSVQQEFIPRSATQAAGMYFIVMNIDGINMTKKLVVY